MIKFTYRIGDFFKNDGLKKISQELSDPQVILKDIGLYVLGSIWKNFEAGGRPYKWKPSQRALRERNLTLVDKDNLRQGIRFFIVNNKCNFGPSGKSASYAAIHQFGGPTIAPQGHSIIMPERPYILLQDEDKEAIKRIAINHVLKIVQEMAGGSHEYEIS